MLMSLARRDELVDSWRRSIDRVRYAFQPITSTHTGQAVGFEALLRDVDRAGFASIGELFDRATSDGVVVDVSLMLLGEAARALTDAPVNTQELGRLFYNLDNRLFDSEEGCRRLFDAIGTLPLPVNRITFEISERAPLPERAYQGDQLPILRAVGAQVALDDFGTGYSGLQVLYRAGVDLIKLDRFFVQNIDRDPTKRTFVTNMVRLAHTMGIRVVAEGVERSGEFYACRDIGCDYVQGYLVARPSTENASLRPHYETIEQLVAGNRRESRVQRLLLDRLNPIEPIHVNEPIIEVLKRFRGTPELSFLPVVNDLEEPVGILREIDLKQYVYNPYGISLLMNHTYQREIYEYVRRVPVVSPGARLDHVLELYALDHEADAIIVARNGRYEGVLDSRSLIQVVHEREVATARDQNPLTRLPGNSIVNEHLAGVHAAAARWHGITYFDFNDFKPFNDVYGFRVGDRVIQLFADMLRSHAAEDSRFVGHIGGDDFFYAFECDAGQVPEEVVAIRALTERFSGDVVGFYRSEDQARGYMEATDRNGVFRRFPLLTISAAVLLVPPHDEALASRELSHQIATLKRFAKRSSDSVAAASVVASALRAERDAGYD